MINLRKLKVEELLKKEWKVFKEFNDVKTTILSKRNKDIFSISIVYDNGHVGEILSLSIINKSGGDLIKDL